MNQFCCSAKGPLWKNYHSEVATQMIRDREVSCLCVLPRPKTDLHVKQVQIGWTPFIPLEFCLEYQT